MFLMIAFFAQMIAIFRRWIRTAFPSFLSHPRPGDSTIFSPWMEALLKKKGHIEKSVGVTSVEVSDLSENRGFVGSMKKVLVKLDNETQINLMMKMSYDGVQGRMNVSYGGSFREGIFYQSIFAKSASNIIPKIFYSYGSLFFGEYVVLMEDLNDRKNCIGANFIFGNQIWGIPEEKKKILPDPDKSIEKIFSKMADFHIKHWNDPSLLEANWLRGTSWRKGKGRTSWEASLQKANSCWKYAKEKLIKNGSLEFSEKLMNIMDESFSKTSWEQLQSQISDTSVPFTLCHGDFHAANMFFQNENPILVDWSEVGPWEPTTDLAQMVISDVKPQLFQQKNKRLGHSILESLKRIRN